MKVMGQNDTSFQCDGSNSTFRVMFKRTSRNTAKLQLHCLFNFKGKTLIIMHVL